MIIGYDGGYGNIKTSKDVIFPAKIKQFNRSFQTDEMKVIYKNKNYVIGKGSYDINLNKSSDEHTKVFMLTALALSSQEKEFRVVTGLPIKQFKKYKDELKDELTKEKINYIKIGDFERIVILEDLYVFPQCLGCFYSLDEEILKRLDKSDILIIDIGSRTVDISLIKLKNGKRVVDKYSTVLEGTLSLYSDFVYEINAKFELDLKIEEAERILREGLYIGGEKQDLNFTRDIILEHFREIYKEVELNYPVKTSATFLAGGGAYLYGSLFKHMYKNIKTIKNAQFANAKGFEKVGKSLWEK